MKVLLLQIMIPHYRVAVFNKLAEKVDLTVIYSNGEVPADAKFKTIYIPTRTVHYKIHKKNLYKIAKNYDVFICMFDFSYWYVRLMSFMPRKYKLIYWGIGVSAGYNSRYDVDQKTAKRYFKRAKQADAMLFYSSYPIEKYAKMGIPREKLFVANNTVKVLPCKLDTIKDSILFIGSLYKQKKIDELLANYQRAYEKDNSVPPLFIIGDGDERENIQKWTIENGLIEKIKLLGQINDDEILIEYFKRAIVCISPDQAGLSVLKSMGYGVPYITHRNAITGGEIFNIHDGVDGVLFDNFDEIEDIVLECSSNPEKYLNMGKEAQKYYYGQRTVDKMVEGFLNAINYVERI